MVRQWKLESFKKRRKKKKESYSPLFEAKVRKALDSVSGEIVAVKILDKERMISLGIQHLVKNEIGIWKVGSFFAGVHVCSLVLQEKQKLFFCCHLFLI
jgi:hypothetical protein